MCKVATPENFGTRVEIHSHAVHARLKARVNVFEHCSDEYAL
jgi:hypothetical protein